MLARLSGVVFDHVGIAGCGLWLARASYMKNTSNFLPEYGSLRARQIPRKGTIHVYI